MKWITFEEQLPEFNSGTPGQPAYLFEIQLDSGKNVILPVHYVYGNIHGWCLTFRGSTETLEQHFGTYVEIAWAVWPSGSGYASIDHIKTDLAGKKQMDDAWIKLDFEKLKRGDIVRNVGSDLTFLVDSNYKDRATAVATYDITNEEEWLVYKRK